MARFCTNCGTKVDDNSTMCTNCGNPLENVKPVNTQNPTQNQMPQPTPMPNYGGMPQPTPMPSYGNMPQQSTVGVATTPQAEPKKEENSFGSTSNPSNTTVPPYSPMPNNNIPTQNPMPNSMPGSMPNSMPNNGIPTANGVTPGFGATSSSVTKGNNGKTIAIVGIAVGVIIALIVAAIIVLSSFSGGYKSVINTKLKAAQERDPEGIAKTYPVFLYQEDFDTFGDFVDAVENDAIPGIEDMLTVLQGEVGDNVKLSYKIEDVKDVSEKKFNDFCDGIEEVHGYDTSKIKEIKKADIVVTAKGDDGTTDFDWEDVYLIKDNGEWYILNMDLEFANIEGSDSIWHSDYYEYYK